MSQALNSVRGVNRLGPVIHVFVQTADHPSLADRCAADRSSVAPMNTRYDYPWAHEKNHCRSVQRLHESVVVFSSSELACSAGSSGFSPGRCSAVASRIAIRLRKSSSLNRFVVLAGDRRLGTHATTSCTRTSWQKLLEQLVLTARPWLGWGGETRCQKSARPQTIGDNPSEGRQPKEKYPNRDHDPRHHRVCTLACRWIRILSSLRKFDVHPANQA